MSEAVSVYFIWGVFVAPFVGAVLVPLLQKAPRVRDYAAVLFSFVSAVSHSWLFMIIANTSSFPLLVFT